MLAICFTINQHRIAHQLVSDRTDELQRNVRLVRGQREERRPGVHNVGVERQFAGQIPNDDRTVVGAGRYD